MRNRNFFGAGGIELNGTVSPQFIPQSFGLFYGQSKRRRNSKTGSGIEFLDYLWFALPSSLGISSVVGQGEPGQISDERPVAALRSAVAVQAVATHAPMDSKFVGTQKQARSATPAVQTAVAQASAHVGILCASVLESARRANITSLSIVVSPPIL